MKRGNPLLSLKELLQALELKEEDVERINKEVQQLSPLPLQSTKEISEDGESSGGGSPQETKRRLKGAEVQAAVMGPTKRRGTITTLLYLHLSLHSILSHYKILFLFKFSLILCIQYNDLADIKRQGSKEFEDSYHHS